MWCLIKHKDSCFYMKGFDVTGLLLGTDLWEWQTVDCNVKCCAVCCWQQWQNAVQSDGKWECGHWLCVVETAVTADRRIRRRKGGGWGVSCLHLLPFGSSSTSLHAVTCQKTAIIMRMLGCARCRQLLTVNRVIHRGLTVKVCCHVKLCCMLLANWNCVYHLVCVECRKYTSKHTCERRIVTRLVWGSVMWV
jgi:hypothetical protein